MNTTNKIKSLLTLNKKNLVSFSEHMEVTPQATSKKAKNQTWNIKDLLNIADLTGTQLAFIDEKGDVVIKFDLSDLQKDDKKST